MGTTLFDGIPTHVLFAHFVVVLVPLAALVLVLCALGPSLMLRFGLAVPLLALASLVAVPFTTASGEWLEDHVRKNGLVERHAEAGDSLLPWAISLFVVAVALWWVYRRVSRSDVESKPGRGWTAGVGVPVHVVAVVVSLVVAIGAGWKVYDIGHSGAKAAWSGFSRHRTVHGG
ncbi:DUF2231 domain-containing protein [Streptomyces silvisoli]|uniref:DUF2231 domain-containing protein n=1 Tax=Streptomyces silvisoli TaxID=3034235 RepID=A0ABT5ZNY5_9ACTN|nr:DUF2231 domain-containing protein [Streptomyces silvisoli]MDF3291540.1 hypothetical protein [Streptomyces silvisoli]